MNFNMIHAFLFSIFISLLVSEALGNNKTPECDPTQNSFSFLDVAMDMITKAKVHFPTKDEKPTVVQNIIANPVDCEELQFNGKNKSGVYTIWPRNRVTGDKSLEVYCDMDTDGGGWTVIQRRGNFNRSKDYFYKDWKSFKAGFGDIERDFWLGNDNIFALTNQRLNSIRFDLKAVDGERRYALYDTFWIEDETRKYTLHINDYSGDAGDSMISRSDNMMFTTKDQKNDKFDDNCAVAFKGAWWHNACHDANLNGLYHRGTHDSFADGVNWRSWRGYHESLDTTEMKIRPKNFRKTAILNDTPSIEPNRPQNSKSNPLPTDTPARPNPLPTDTPARPSKVSDSIKPSNSSISSKSSNHSDAVKPSSDSDSFWTDTPSSK
ncbi:techylectin-5A [Trichonephila clavipes]|nr:techylectin-5A [Trichonephila clavipes]